MELEGKMRGSISHAVGYAIAMEPWCAFRKIRDGRHGALIECSKGKEQISKNLIGITIGIYTLDVHELNETTWYMRKQVAGPPLKKTSGGWHCGTISTWSDVLLHVASVDCMLQVD
jgi:hypothetical protein